MDEEKKTGRFQEEPFLPGPDFLSESNDREVPRPTTVLLDQQSTSAISNSDRSIDLSLWKILQLYGNPGKMINVIKGSYRNARCAMRCEGALSDWFDIITGVRQGDIWSPRLFGLDIHFVMKTSVDAQNTGLTLIPRRSSRYPQKI